MSELSILETIQSRREITQFKNEKLSEEVLSQIVDAGYYAPTGNHLQSREFIVVTEREMLDHLEKTTPFMKWMKTAQAALVITGRRDISKYWLQDASIAAAFIWLTATELNVGLGFGAIYHSEDHEESEKRESYVRNALHIPADRNIVAVLGLGYADEKPKEKKHHKREEIVHYETFNGEQA